MVNTSTSPKLISFLDNSTIGPILLPVTFIRCYVLIFDAISIIKSISNALIQVVVNVISI